MEDKISTVTQKLLGIPYVHNGRDYSGVDCLGLIYLFFAELGIKFPTDDGKNIEDNWYKVDPERYERGLKSAGKEVGSYQNLQRLDVPYFRLYRNVVTHTGVMIDTIHFLHVLIDKEVEIGTMERRFWRKKYAGAIRLDSTSQL